MENQTENKTMETPQMPPSTNTIPNLPTETSQHFAGFWIRFLAVLIDGIILNIVFKILNLKTYSTIGTTVQYNLNGWPLLISAAYYIGFWVWQSATPGKMVLNLKIIEESGAKLTWQKAIIRYLSMMLSGIVFGLGFIWVAFNPKKQGWHDLLAKTYVVKTK
ncbi:MAG: RDD family protein [Candidatus Magasanikbacteria bacterium CG_4_10_14_0_8_um_filter_32_14]|uniref:RDD family protein n=1 Tax=Candidatus Magasanikbacteria bacterium CG_4_10_14_0_8_um_filter_32_14 TaxID=1974640 RepID=A0A2M7R9H2_9BACT|nr:MAG: RDD family protein [Candidatus Magasanikbacteria bacterium CG_4_10_14_0_8_um_filter_32_14]